MSEHTCDADAEIVDGSPRQLTTPSVDDHLEAALEAAAAPQVRSAIRETMQLRLAAQAKQMGGDG